MVPDQRYKASSPQCKAQGMPGLQAVLAEENHLIELSDLVSSYGA